MTDRLAITRPSRRPPLLLRILPVGMLDLPVHADDISATTRLKLLIRPNVGGLSDAQCASIRQFVEHGGSLFATGDTSLYKE